MPVLNLCYSQLRHTDSVFCAWKPCGRLERRHEQDVSSLHAASCVYAILTSVLTGNTGCVFVHGGGPFWVGGGYNVRRFRECL